MWSREEGHGIFFGDYEWKEDLAGGHSQNLGCPKGAGFQSFPHTGLLRKGFMGAISSGFAPGDQV